MKCEICQENQATIHVTEVREDPDVESGDHLKHHISHQHICANCAGQLELPFVPPPKKSVAHVKQMAEIWKVIQATAQKQHAQSALTCPDCGLSLTEFRAKGRLGCARCYEVFAEHVGPLLERIHSASAHKGRLPHRAAEKEQRATRLAELKRRLDEAVRSEDYEAAATIRDELRALETGS
jgi:protein arginine kinase activator